MPRAPIDIRSLARLHTTAAIASLAGIATNGENESARVAASIALLDRGWGKAPSTHTGQNGEGPITVEIVVRERLNQTKVIEHAMPEEGTSD